MIVRLADVAEVASGYHFREAVVPEPSGSHYAIQAKDIDSAFRLDAAGMTRVNPAGDVSKYVVRPEDLVFLSRGRYGAAVVGQVPGRTIASGSLFILRVDPGRVDPRYLHWYFSNHESQSGLRAIEGGAAMAFIRKSDLEQFEVPLPPIATQRAIAEAHGLRLREAQLLRDIATRREALIDETLTNAARRAAKE